jgi:AcrR family transcriptional regulator
MPKRKFLLADPAKPEGPDNAHTREKIEAACVELMSLGGLMNHDAVAERASVSRRTVYRYFPDKEALRQAAWKHLSPAGGLPHSLDQLLGEMSERFEKFDRNAAAMTVAMASAEGRAIRNVMKPERVAAWRGMLDERLAALPEPDRTRAIAVLQLIGTGLAWREMRDQWDMEAEGMTVACRWAIETLLADLERRGARPLSEGPS